LPWVILKPIPGLFEQRLTIRDRFPSDFGFLDLRVLHSESEFYGELQRNLSWPQRLSDRFSHRLPERLGAATTGLAKRVAAFGAVFLQ
jgi:hypothetical protein